MKVDPQFLKDVQAAGWEIEVAEESRVFGRCPRSGCRLKVVLRPGKSIPETCAIGPDLAEVTVEHFETARVFLRDRREQLCLTIKELEEAAGITVDFMAKFEKDDPSKIPNTQTFIEWAQSLGYDVVLRPGKLPPNVLRLMADTRERVLARRNAFKRFHRLRSSSRDG